MSMNYVAFPSMQNYELSREHLVICGMRGWLYRCSLPALIALLALSFYNLPMMYVCSGLK